MHRVGNAFEPLDFYLDDRIRESSEFGPAIRTSVQESFAQIISTEMPYIEPFEPAICAKNAWY